MKDKHYAMSTRTAGGHIKGETLYKPTGSGFCPATMRRVALQTARLSRRRVSPHHVVSVRRVRLSCTTTHAVSTHSVRHGRNDDGDSEGTSDDELLVVEGQVGHGTEGGIRVSTPAYSELYERSRGSPSEGGNGVEKCVPRGTDSVSQCIARCATKQIDIRQSTNSKRFVVSFAGSTKEGRKLTKKR